VILGGIMFKKYKVVIDGQEYLPEVLCVGHNYVLTEVRSHSVVRGTGINDPDEVYKYWKRNMEKIVERGIKNPRFSSWT